MAVDSSSAETIVLVELVVVSSSYSMRDRMSVMTWISSKVLQTSYMYRFSCGCVGSVAKKASSPFLMRLGGSCSLAP